MTISSAPLPTRASRRAPRTRATPKGWDRAGRWTLALVFAALAGLAVTFEYNLRVAEVAISSALLPFIFSADTVTSVSAGMPAIAFEGSGHWFALRITAECAIAFYVGALLLVSAALIVLPRFPIGRLLIATPLGVLGLALVNQVRLGWLAYALSFQGREVFDWVHVVGGSILMAAGMAATLLAFVVFVARKPRKG